ncbi:MAG: Tex family protein [Mariprofundaceae bacterium]|nr:Tex family protein [Mariprofundaceae bacterium]
MNMITQIAAELQVKPQQIKAAVALMDEGATVPFIARYRKEVTAGLDDIQLRALEKRLHYLRDFEARKTSILNSIKKQDLLTAALEQSILATETLAHLEDLYLPYKPKRRSKATAAREAGLEPLAMDLLANMQHDPEQQAQAYLNAEAGIDDVPAALLGAQEILMDVFAVDAALLSKLRRDLYKTATVTSQVVKKKQDEAEKFEDYFSYEELLKKIPSHRALALFRGQQAGFLRVKMVENRQEDNTAFCATIARHFNIVEQQQAAYDFLSQSVGLAWKKILKRFQTDFFQQLRDNAEAESIQVFGANLRDLMLAAPAGQRATLGLDPGIRTGVKVAVVDQHGQLLDTTVIYPFQPKNRWQESIAALAVLADKYKFELVAIGNGTGSRETEKLVAELIEKFPNFKLTSVVVSEAGASVYSASELASLEFPDVDVALRGAVSIARRLQDPLAELVKIEPKAIGVGQYQHDVNQTFLDDALVRVVEDCVNHVGVDVNTASVELLSYVSGLNKKVAAQIVAQRDVLGAFSSRQQLQDVKGLGPKSFEQAAGFLRILNGDNPLDASAVHPESYVLVQKILQDLTMPLAKVMEKPALLADIQVKNYVDGQFGVQTIKDVLLELEKPGRDPRPSFKTAKFKSGVHEVHDLRQGMMLEGVVSNVTNFGAFVDVGVHQDGLVHISALADLFVDDPRKVVKAGQVVQVKVLDVDVKRKRISLTMRLTDELPLAVKAQSGDKKATAKGKQAAPQKRGQSRQKSAKRDVGKAPADSALAAAFAKALAK